MIFKDDLQESINKDINFSHSDLFFVKMYTISKPIIVEPHFHKWLEIVYYYDGDGGDTTINGNTYRYCAGECIVVKPYSLHSFNTYSPQKIVVLLSRHIILPLRNSGTGQKKMSRQIHPEVQSDTKGISEQKLKTGITINLLSIQFNGLISPAKKR